MFAFSPDSASFLLDGEERLCFDYDEQADILYLWRGEAPRPAISLTTDDGIVIRFDELSGEVVGFTVINWVKNWASHGASVEINVPDLELPEGHRAHGERHELELVCA